MSMVCYLSFPFCALLVISGQLLISLKALPLMPYLLSFNKRISAFMVLKALCLGVYATKKAKLLGFSRKLQNLGTRLFGLVD